MYKHATMISDDLDYFIFFLSISNAYFLFSTFYSLLETLRNISCMNFVKTEPIHRTCSSHVLQGVSQTHDGHIWCYEKAQNALFRVLVAGIPTDVNFSL